MKTRSSVGLILAIVLVGPLFTASSALAKVDVVLTVTGVTGESAITQGAMDILSYSWGESSGALTKKGVLPSSCIQDIAVMKVIDSASPQLIANSVTGVVATEAVLRVDMPVGTDQQTIFSLTMSNVTVVSYQISGSSERPVESVVLHFQNMIGSYRPMKADGTLGTPITFNIAGGVCR